MKKVIAVVMFVLALGIGYIGINKVSDSTKSFNFLGIKVEASDQSGRTEGFIYIGIAVVLLAGGMFMLGKSRESAG